MYKNLRWKLLVIAGITALAAWSFIPPSQKIKLGLDLKGGVHMVLKVETDEALKVETETNAEQLQEAAKDANLGIGPVRPTGITEFTVESVPPAGDQQFRVLAEQIVGASFNREPGANGGYAFRMKPNVAVNRRAEAVAQAILTIDKRVNELGVAEPIVAPYGTAGNQIVIQLPGVSDIAHAKAIIGKTARLEIKLVESEAPDEASLLSAHGGKVPEDMEMVPGISGTRDGSKAFYLVKKIAAITGSDLANAKPTLDELNLPAVSFTLKSGGVAKFSKVTGDNVGRQLAIILDGLVQSAPRIDGRISQAEARITGSFTQAEAQDLSLILRSGALPASLTSQEQREVGPSLGNESVRAGVTASVVGLVLVTMFMLVYYRLAGINALVSISLNLAILMGIMAYLGAVMTLPGIAGFVLTIGMGVDSNVLIFERIREELALKKGARQAIAAGFDRVFVTIIDTHVASLIAALFLLQFGTGPIRGFATTLIAGLASNVFTSVFVSRTMFEFILSRRPAGSAQQISI